MGGVFSHQFFKTENERVNSSRFCQDVKFDVAVLQTTSNKLNVIKCAPLVQYDYLLYGKLRERAVCSEVCVLIGYTSGQDGAILPARDCPFRSRK